MTFIKKTALGFDVIETNIRLRGNGWMLVPEEMKDGLLAVMPFVRLTLDRDVVVGFEEDEGARENPPEPPALRPDPQADTDAMLVDHEFRLALLELGGV